MTVAKAAAHESGLIEAADTTAGSSAVPGRPVCVLPAFNGNAAVAVTTATATIVGNVFIRGILFAYDFKQLHVENEGGVGAIGLPGAPLGP